MPIEAGQTLLHYTLAEKIGEGGMGAVWRANDTTLNRDVAIKVLPQVFAEDPDRLARFEREAKLLASLNHPNIAAVYGLHQAETSEGTLRFLTMELVEGEDLSKRLERGPLSVDTALQIAAQMAAGIEAAHEKGVVHRDLKPANVIVAPDGRVRLLDFGLAKAFEANTGSSDPSLSPTMTSAGTVAGMILGTAAYMSPEQARGKVVDRRTDMWSFGCVLHECLTGKSLFGGETISDSLAAILRKDVDFDELPQDTPPMVRLLLRRCLARDPNKRLRDAGDARLELEQAIENPDLAELGLTQSSAAPAAALKTNTTGWLPWAVAAVAGAGLLFVLLSGGKKIEQRGTTSPRFTIPVVGLTQFGDNSAAPPIVSPDGRWIAYGMTGAYGMTIGVDQLWLRPIDQFESRPLAGTEGGAFPFWSPDSKHLGFFIGGRLKRIEIASGRVQSIGGDGTIQPRGASWSVNDQIIFVPNSNTGVWIVDAAGGEPRQLTTPDPEIPDCSHRWPHFLPDGEHYLFLLWTNDPAALEEHGGVYLASISSDSEPVRVLPDASSMAYTPSGHLLVMQEDNLVAMPFDTDKLEAHGEGTLVSDGVVFNGNNGHAAFSASAEGTLVFAPDSGTTPSTSLVWSDRSGVTTETPLEPTPMSAYLSLDPGGARVVTLMPGATGDSEVWIVDLLRGVRTRLVRPGPWSYFDPMWSPTGDRVLYVSTESGTWDLYVQNADGSGSAEVFLATDGDKSPYDWDGRRLLYYEAIKGGTSIDHRIYDQDTKESSSVVEAAEPIQARFSPDGRFFAYVLTESGRAEVFIQSIEGGARWQVSTAGGRSPHWSNDGREVVYVDPERRVMAVSVQTDAGRATLTRPVELFQGERGVIALEPTGDHQRFLLAVRPEADTAPIHVILNWDAGL